MTARQNAIHLLELNDLDFEEFWEGRAKLIQVCIPYSGRLPSSHICQNWNEVLELLKDEGYNPCVPRSGEIIAV